MTKRGTTRLATMLATLILATLAAVTHTNAIDMSLNIPIPALFNSLRRASDDAQDSNAPPAHASRRGDRIPQSVQTPTASQNPADALPQSQNAYQPPQRPSEPLQSPQFDVAKIDLTPEYSNYLPYCVVLGRVVCESNFPLDQLQGMAAEITQLQIDLTTYLQTPPADEKIELCLFKDKKSYAQFINDVFPSAPCDRPALYIKEAGKPGVIMAPQDQNLMINVRHEMTHAFLNSSLKNVPIWIDEGLAKYFETPPGERGFRNPYLKTAEDAARGFFSSPPSLARLEKLSNISQMKTREYRESWSWVHFMMHYSPETHRVLALYLRSLRPENQVGINSEQARKIQAKTPLKHALAQYVPDYEKKYVEHFRQWDKKQDQYERARAQSFDRSAQ
ncbi:MAG: hypothetical protein Q4G03_11805 [Planctomycetia bacterium]|nr:hypothetical protein [Planctomycetia bacterium]